MRLAALAVGIAPSADAGSSTTAPFSEASQHVFSAPRGWVAKVGAQMGGGLRWLGLKIAHVLIIFFGVVNVAFGLFYFAMLVWDWNTYASATAQKEKAAATAQFLWSCKHNKLDPRDFAGPYRDYGDNSVHVWIWSLRRDRSRHIAVHISYMPYEISDTISTVLVHAERAKPRQ
jgi:hypothetical protein